MAKTSSEHPPMTTWEIVKSPGVPIVLFIWCMALLLGMAFTAGKLQIAQISVFRNIRSTLILTSSSHPVVPVFWFTSVDLGGFGFDPKTISRFLALSGISQA